MADQKAAIDYVVKTFEDATMQGKVTPDMGGQARFGINSLYHPELVEKGFFDEEKMDRDDAWAVAQTVYEEQYTAKLDLDKIESQQVANKLTDMAINMGVNEAVKLIQRAATLCKSPVDEDNVMGPRTSAAINLVSPGNLLAMMRQVAIDFYTQVSAVKQVTPSEFRSWIARANRLGV